MAVEIARITAMKTLLLNPFVDPPLLKGYARMFFRKFAELFSTEICSLNLRARDWHNPCFIRKQMTNSKDKKIKVRKEVNQMKIATSFLAALLLAVSLVASAAYAEDEIVSGQARAQETRNLKYAQD